ncbi:hypothetical protein EHI47_05950 [Rhizobium leguminosarum]|jgi:hypothetical protein|uniref:Uncharacterized protein n=2 Tax=Rhizobium TaxID=379 RepID=A0A444I8F7_RHILE|nr:MULTISPECIES: hypothetical protein [Rhizobium]RWX34890.1 hypothetical protein EHI47_05950 [Rhizobium leguminosarum]TAU53215.1 hypothetical protein ELI43_10600 [Rhizobium leguminosarum]TBC73231.1 hypothetical protein ELH27_10420 [Rhizobium leguminosarum]TBC94404.1 hypothetical protein ELH26_10405 [Rhizobium leguminosarum]TBD04932.1 hypothetical protein ELH21_11295 [Rhizobium leguminosarum]
MSEFRLAFPACVVAGKHRLTAEDIVLLRKHSFPEGIRTSDDVVAMLALNNSCPEKCADWNAFFVEQLAGFIVHYTYPQGSLDEINVAWIMRMFTTDGVVNSALELELILHVMEISADVPVELRALALDQLRLAITDNIGGYKLSRAIDRRGISRQDVDYAMRIFRSVAEGGIIPVSSVEYGVLQQIEQATLSGANHPHWAGIMAAVELRAYAEPRRSRWLRIVDEEPVSEAAVA